LSAAPKAVAPADIIFANTEEALAAARLLTPRLAARAERCEELRRCPEESIADMHASGLMRLMQPARWGGSDLGIDSMVEVTIELARGCSSSAWVWLNLASHSWNIGQFGLQAQEDVWGQDRHAVGAGGLAFPCGKAVAVPGGYRVSGRWPFGSGIDASSWDIVGAMVEREGGPPERRMFLVPRADFRSLDNWRAYGLTGSGSHDVEIRDAFVPEHRSMDGPTFASGIGVPGAALNPAPWYRLPTFAAFGFGLAALPLAIARTAIAEFLESVKKRTGTYTGARLAELAPLQMRVAEAAACVDFAETQMRADMGEMIHRAKAGEASTMEMKLAWKRNIAFGTGLCNRAVDSLMAASGAGAISSDGRMQRHFRDIHAISSHIALTWDVQAVAYGQNALGLPPQAGLLL
jgi:3-hydroxy-9,10-secoandrosta-1,3,5(10)-triene-9,17-dione monooxygenase